MLEIHLHQIADIRTVEDLATWGLAPGDIRADDMTRCQEMATVTVRLGYEAVRWRSATGTGESLALYVDQLRPGSRVQITNEFPLTRVMLGELQRGAPITALIPELSRYALLS